MVWESALSAVCESALALSWAVLGYGNLYLPCSGQYGMQYGLPLLALVWYMGLCTCLTLCYAVDSSGVGIGNGPHTPLHVHVEHLHSLVRSTHQNQVLQQPLSRKKVRCEPAPPPSTQTFVASKSQPHPPSLSREDTGMEVIDGRYGSDVL